jgi:hypothetical protein
MGGSPDEKKTCMALRQRRACALCLTVCPVGKTA